MAVGSISSHCEKDVWSGSSTRTGLMLARLAITSRTKESSNVDDRTRRGSVASKKLEENQFAKLKRVHSTRTVYLLGVIIQHPCFYNVVNGVQQALTKLEFSS